MITDEQVSTALEYLAIHPHPQAVAEWELAKASIAVEQRHAELYLMVKGTVAEREARIEGDNEYGDLRYVEAEWKFKLTSEKARVRSCEAVVEMWRTEQANARVAERVR